MVAAWLAEGLGCCSGNWIPGPAPSAPVSAGSAQLCLNATVFERGDTGETIMQGGTVVRVTEGGRGFVIAAQHRRYVVTAAPCLSHLPPAHAASDIHERTFPNLLGPLTSSRCRVSAAAPLSILSRSWMCCRSQTARSYGMSIQPTKR